MNTFLKGLSTLSTRVIYVIYSILTLLLIVNYFTDLQKDYYILLLIGFLFLCSIGTVIIRRFSLFADKFNEKIILTVLLLVCFVVKLAWVLLYRIEPLVDYATFYYTAEALSNDFVIDSRYVSLFPHIFGYASFLSIFLKLFGASYMVAPIVNVVLSTISMLLLYFIGKKISSVKVGVTASILWIILPSQTIYNMFALSEPLYCTILLLIWLLMIMVHEKFQSIAIKKLIFYSVLLALLLVFMNMSRPIAAVPIIALSVWMFVVNTEHLNNKQILSKKLIYIFTILASYFILSFAANQYMSIRLGGEVAEVPGHTIYVGFNVNSSGGWNAEDSELLSRYNEKEGWSVNDVQKQMLEEAKNRIVGSDIDFLDLMWKKFIVFLGDDSVAAGYAQSVLDHELRYKFISNTFYYFLIAASFIGTCMAYKNKDKSPVLFICLYGIGLTMAQLLVEVAARYHYSMTLTMIILSALGIHQVFNNEKKIDDK